MSKRTELEFPKMGYELKDLSKVSNTKLTRSVTDFLSKKDQAPLSKGGAPRKKINKEKADDSGIPQGLHLLSLSFANSEEDNVLHSKRMSRLSKSHLPIAIKLIEPLMSSTIEVLNFQLSVNKKTASKDWIVEYYNGKCKQIGADSKMLGLQEPAYYSLRQPEFSRRFAHKMRKLSHDQITKVFNSFCLPNEDIVHFPVAVLQPLNFDNLNEVGYVIGEGIEDRKDILAFSVPPEPKEVQEDLVEVVLRSNDLLECSEQDDHAMVPLIPEPYDQPSHHDFEVGPKTVLVWFIGTNVYSFVDIHDRRLQHFNSITEDKAESLFSKTALKDVREEVVSLLKTSNRSLKLYSTDLKPQQKRLFMYRLARSKNVPAELSVVLRFRQIKEERQILLRNLRTCELQWESMDLYQVCYTLPQFSKDQLQYLYILDQLPLYQRQQAICQLLLGDFYHQHLDMHPLFKQYFPDKPWPSKNRCVQCFYILHTLPCFQCFFCHRCCHKKCLTPFTQKQMVQVGHSLEWVCSSCMPCKVCFSRVDQPLVCHECGSRFHSECGRTRDRIAELAHYECEDCLKCDVCGKRLRNCKEGGYVLVEENIECEECNSIQGDYCAVCKRASNNQNKTEWIQCTKCEGWVHKSCDAPIARTHSRHFAQPSAEYHCPKCRSLTRRSYLKMIIQILKKFDEYLYFTDTDYDRLPDYRDIIRNPICFKTMLQKCSQGQYDTDSKQKITSDFHLIVSNALTYNMPKDDPHKSARIMKLMGDLVLDGLDEFFKIEELDLILKKDVESNILMKEREIFKYIYGHYLETVLNYGQTNSRVVVKLKTPVEMPQILYFKAKDVLQRFKNCQIELIYAKQQPRIQHLFSLHKTVQGALLPATNALCYYHHQPQILSSCSICCEAFCCVKKCFLHLVCSYCNTKGCRCWSWGCGCRAGYTNRDLQNPLFKGYEIREITEMYTYCLKCSAGNFKWRECKYCQKLCSYGYVKCESCSKRFHKACCKKTFIPRYCYECERSPAMENKLKEQLKQETRRQLFRMIRTERYVPLVLRLFLEEGIRLEVHQVRQLIFNNYDKVEEHLEQMEFYEGNIFQIEKTKIKQQRTRLMQETIYNHLSDFKSRLTDGQAIQPLTSIQFTVIDKHGNNLLKDHQYRQLFDKFFIQQTLQVIEKVQAFLTPKLTPQDVLFQTNMQIQNEDFNYSGQTVALVGFSSKPLTRSLYSTSLLLRPKLMTVSDTRSQTHDYKNSQLTIRKLQEVSQNCRNLFISFYNQFRTYPRMGSTSIIHIAPNKLKVFKKWDNSKPGTMITLTKNQGTTWTLILDNQTRILHTYKDLLAALTKFRQFTTIDDLGAFLGFTIHDRKPNDYSYTKFLQTNPLDNDSFLERKEKVMSVYNRVANNTVQKKDLFFLNKKTSPQNKQPQSKRNFDSFYILFEQIKKDLEDLPKQDKVTPKFTQPTKQIFIAPSTIHKLGLFSRKHHPKNTVLIQYMGQVLGQPIADIREAQFHLGCYMFGIPKRQQTQPKYSEDTVDQYTPHIQSKKDVIDATFRGNQARYLNHSCDPNCASTVEYSNEQPRILIYAIRDIQPYEELTYDYQFKVSADEKLTCTCGARNCQGRLN